MKLEDIDLNVVKASQAENRKLHWPRDICLPSKKATPGAR